MYVNMYNTTGIKSSLTVSTSNGIIRYSFETFQQLSQLFLKVIHLNLKGEHLTSLADDGAK